MCWSAKTLRPGRSKSCEWMPTVRAAAHGRVLKYIQPGPVAAIHSEPDVPGANIVFPLPAAASRFSAFAANDRSQFSPVTGQGREHAFGVHASRRSQRISCLTAGQDFIPDARKSVRPWPQWPRTGHLRSACYMTAMGREPPIGEGSLTGKTGHSREAIPIR
jgi:hypothetical protein